VTCDAFRGDVDVTFAHTRATKTTRTMDSVMRQSMRYATTRRRGRDAGEDGRTVGLFLRDAFEWTANRRIWIAGDY